MPGTVCRGTNDFYWSFRLENIEQAVVCDLPYTRRQGCCRKACVEEELACW